MAEAFDTPYEAILEVIPDPVIIADEESGAIVKASGQVRELLGYAPGELVGKNQTVLHPSDDRERYATLFAQQTARDTDMFSHFSDGSPLYIETKDGDRIPIEIHAKRIELDDRRLVVGIIRDTTARHEYEELIETQRDNLKLLNEVMRHDIRNHLQLIGSYAAMLDEHVEGDGEGEEYLDVIEESAELAVELTETVRHLADVLLQFDCDPQPTPLIELLAKEVDGVRSSYPDATVTVEAPLSEIHVLADDMIAVVFRNVIKNAIQHNDTDRPTVTITVETGEDRAAVRVADNGPGVPDAQKERIFGRGEQGLESAGTGIGLYLVETLIDGYRGDVWVEDNDSGGAVFVIQLPTARGEP